MLRGNLSSNSLKGPFAGKHHDNVHRARRSCHTFPTSPPWHVSQEPFPILGPALAEGNTGSEIDFYKKTKPSPSVDYPVKSEPITLKTRWDTAFWNQQVQISAVSLLPFWYFSTKCSTRFRPLPGGARGRRVAQKNGLELVMKIL